MFAKAHDKIAFIWKDESISYRDMLQSISSYAGLFDKEKTAKVAILSENRPEWAYAFYAAWKNDCTAVPIDFMAPADEIAYILRDCRPEIIFCSKEKEKTVALAMESIEHELQVHVFEEITSANETCPAEEIGPDDMQKTAALIYTSGTTGSPKGVMLSFENLAANIKAITEDIPIYTENRNVMALLPLHHVFPLVGTLITPVFMGATIAFTPSMTASDIISTLQKNGIGIILGVPRLYSALHKGIMDKINGGLITRSLFRIARIIGSRSFSRTLFGKVHKGFGGKVDYLVSGGAKLDEDVARDFKTLGFEMLEGYGMTEAGPLLSFTHPGHWKVGSAGYPVPGIQMEIRDGEVVARGRNIMQGYYRRPAETAEVMKDGWLYTGDTGHIDAKGFLHITGRTKEILVLSSGKNINPEEIENKLRSLSLFISEVCVFLKNDTLKAAIFPDFRKLSDEGILNIEEMFRWKVIDYYNQSAASYKRITKFVLLKEELPKTRLGKIQRFKIGDLDEGTSKSRREEMQEPQHEEYAVIRDYLRSETAGKIWPDDHIELDLGLDSLDKVSLLAFLESTFGITTGEDVLINNPTVEKLSRFMQEKKSKLTVETVKWAEILKEKVDLSLPRTWFTQNIFKNSSRVLFKTYFRFKGEGLENLPDGPFIMAPNHQSIFDGLFVSAFLHNKMMNNTYFYAKEKHFKNRWMKALANRNNIIIMDINKDLKQSLQKLAEVLKKGKNVIIFPEGTRTRNGKIGKFKKAFAILSQELNVPVVPVSIKGAFEALPSGSWIPRPWKKIDIKYHLPIYPENCGYDMLLERVHAKLSTELA